MKLRKILFTALLIGGLLAGVGYLFRAQLSVAIAQKMVAKAIGADGLADLPDGLHIGLCGAGSPFPDEKRNGPCTVVIAGKRVFVIDAGNGSVRNLSKMRISHGRIEAIFLTHFHSDHIDGLGELLLQRWVSMSNQAPVPVYGPTGVERVVGGLMEAYTLDRGYRVAHHGDATMPASGFGALAKPFTVGNEGRIVLVKDADLEIVAFTVDHAPIDPAVGYRIAYKGRTVVLSGDTKKSAAVQREAQGVDLLVHEALSEKLTGLLAEGAQTAGRKNLVKIFADIVNYHTTPEQAAEIARDAKVASLLFNHIAPPLPVPGMEKAFLGDAPALYSGPIRVGADGDFASLPTGSKSITIRRLF